MPPDRHETVAALRTLLAARGPLSSREATALLRVSQATFARIVKEHSGELLVTGKARATRYAVRRVIPDVDAPVPIHEIDERGEARLVARLHPVGLSGHFVAAACADVDPGFHDDLPYFLDNLRPAGFLGRFIPRIHPDLGLPPDILQWSGDQCLRYATQRAADPVGALIAGEAAFQLYLRQLQAPPASIRENERSARYEALANDVLRGAPAGSSAAGEQPKFLACRGSVCVPVLVKFSPPRTNAVGRRTADLLVAEHVALKVLKEHGVAVSTSTLVEGGDRLFLELERFDRTPAGRRGVLSLEALDLEFVGNQRHGQWSLICRELVRQGVLAPSTLPTVELLSVFGELIANTDMHPGNLSFFARGARATGLAPVYDMAPTYYASRQGELPSHALEVPVPKPQWASVWPAACSAAEQLWSAVADHDFTSRGFARIARQNARAVHAAAKLTSRLPR